MNEVWCVVRASHTVSNHTHVGFLGLTFPKDLAKGLLITLNLLMRLSIDPKFGSLWCSNALNETSKFRM